jgi:hypothetical protein
MFELELPPGVYQIIAEQPGFRKFQLASFEVKAGAKELLKIHMEVDTPKTPLKVHQGFAQEVAAAHYSTASEATGCYTQRTELEKHRVKLRVASGRFARGTVIVARYWEKPRLFVQSRSPMNSPSTNHDGNL